MLFNVFEHLASYTLQMASPWTHATNGFSFLVIFFLFYFGSCGRLSWLNCQLSSAR